MSLEFVNRICPNCKNPNYMVLLGDFSKAHKYKCMNCNEYFNEIDFEKDYTPEEFTEMMKKISENTDPEEAHFLADDLMCTMLEKIGYQEGVKIFKDMEKWYS